MNTIEIICEACDAKMRLSSCLLQRIKGRSGRVTCKQCSNKVGLDASGDGITVVFGGVLLGSAEPLELESLEEDPHLSEGPARDASESRIEVSGRGSSLPPPLPIGARARRHHSIEAPPPPQLRGLEDSLSPHSFEDEVSLAALAHDIRSTPYSAPPPRDLTYNSLYPEPQARAPRSVIKSPWGSRAPTPPRAGELHRSMAPSTNPFESGYGIDLPQGQQAVVVTADGQLLNQADMRHIQSQIPGLNPEGGSRAPWILAAVALFALGISLSVQVQDGVLGAWRSATGAQELRAEPEAGAGPDRLVIHHASVPEVLIEATAPEKTDDSAASGIASAGAALPNRVALPSNAALPDKVAAPNNAATPSKGAAPRTAEVAAAAEQAGEPDAGPFSSGAAAASMREATALSAACRNATDPTGIARVVVTFAPSGRVTSATVSGPPFAGTPAGGCIASRFRAARVPAFSGEAVTVSKTVTIR